MAEALILEFAGLNDADYRAVNGNLGIDMDTGQGDWPSGMLSHAAGPGAGDAWVVTEVWESRADQAAFMEVTAGRGPGRGGRDGGARGPLGAARGVSRVRDLSLSLGFIRLKG